MISAQDLVNLSLIDVPAEETLTNSAQSFVSRSPPIGDLPGATAPPSVPSEEPIPAPPSFFLKALSSTLVTQLTGASNLSDEQQALFIAPNGQAGIPGGLIFPEEVRNYQLFLKADAVQKLNHPLYSIDDANSYYQMVYLYMRYLNYGKNLPEISASRDALIKAEEAKNQEWQRAREEYIQKRGKNSSEISETFINYLSRDAGYQNAWSAEQAAQNKYEDLLPPELQDAARQLNILKSANDRLEYKAGNNMPCDATSQDFLDQALRQQHVIKSDPRNIYFRPSYSLPNYTYIIDSWTNPKPRSTDGDPYTYSIFLDRDSLDSTTWAQLGHKDLDKVVQQPLTKDQRNLLSKIKASVTFPIKPEVLNVERGYWDVSPLHSPLLDPDAPEYLKEKFFKTTKLLLAWEFSVDITLPSGLSVQSIAGIKISKWGIPLRNIGNDGRQLTFRAGGGFYPVLVAALGQLVGGA